MTKSLPDVFKNGNLLESEDTVLIPDIRIVPPTVSVKENSDEDPATTALREQIVREEQARVILQSEAQLTQIRHDAAEQAYGDALRHKEGEIDNCMEEVRRILDDLQEAQNQFFEEYTEKLKELSIDIAEKVLLKKVDEDDLALTKLVTHATISVKSSDWISVEVSEKLSNLVSWLRGELAKPEYSGAEVAPGAFSTDTCRINTPEGVLDASITSQIRNLKEYFSELN